MSDASTFGEELCRCRKLLLKGLNSLEKRRFWGNENAVLLYAFTKSSLIH